MRRSQHSLKKVYAIEDPLSDEARALIEETIAIKETMHELFSIRSRKILALAIMHAEGNYYDREEVKRMLPAEHGMFDQVAAGLLECQDTLLHNAKQPLVPSLHAIPRSIEAAEDDGEVPDKEVPAAPVRSRDLPFIARCTHPHPTLYAGAGA